MDAMKHAKDVVFTGRLNDENLNKVVASAFALTFIPYFEGFGIPMVEAMQCEIPIIASNASCMPEIAGDAALFVNPYDVDEIKNAMLYLYNHPEEAEQLIEKGIKRKQLYSWDKSANLLWNSIEKSLA
jgi:glycosyltransferase involved in cell wall biosynthesis